MNNARQKAIKTAKRYLEAKGLEVLDEGWNRAGVAGTVDLVANERGEIVFVAVSSGELSSDAGFREEPLSREQFELLAAMWLGEHVDELDESDFPVRFDRVSILALSESRAIVRHCVNALGGPFISA